MAKVGWLATFCLAAPALGSCGILSRSPGAAIDQLLSPQNRGAVGRVSRAAIEEGSQAPASAKTASRWPAFAASEGADRFCFATTYEADAIDSESETIADASEALAKSRFTIGFRASLDEISSKSWAELPATAADARVVSAKKVLGDEHVRNGEVVRYQAHREVIIEACIPKPVPDPGARYLVFAWDRKELVALWELTD